MAKTPLHIACRLMVIRILFKHSSTSGADVTVTTHGNGETPLHIACLNGHTGVVQALLDKGAAVVTVTSANGQTPLHIACRLGHTDIVQTLLENGADVNVSSIR